MGFQSIARFINMNAGSFENEALENEDRSTKHPKLENEAPKKLDTGLSFINTRPM